MRGWGSDEAESAAHPREGWALAGTVAITVTLAAALPNLIFWALFSGFSFREDDEESVGWFVTTIMLGGPSLAYGIVFGVLAALATIGALGWAERRGRLPAWAAVIVGATAASLTVALLSALPIAFAGVEELRVILSLYSTFIGLSAWFYPLPLIAAVVSSALTIARLRLRRADAASITVESDPLREPHEPAPPRPSEKAAHLDESGRPESERPARGRLVLARLAITLCSIGAFSPLWVSALNGGLFAPRNMLDESHLQAVLIQIALAAVAPLAAIVFGSLVLVGAGGATVGKSAASKAAAGTRHPLERSRAMGATAVVVSVCVLAATVSMGSIRVAEVQQAIERRDRIAAMPPPEAGNHSPDSGEDVAPTAPAPTLEPEVPSAAMTPDEARLAMEQLIATTVEVITASASAPGSELRWLDASVASQSTGNDGYPQVPAPSAAIEQSCLDGAGVQYSMPSATFALGLITDTSSDDNDSEVIDANVATAERLVAAWTYLGYTEDSALGGNIEMAGPPDAAAVSLGVRYGFGIASVTATGRCVADTR